MPKWESKTLGFKEKNRILHEPTPEIFCRRCVHSLFFMAMAGVILMASASAAISSLTYPDYVANLLITSDFMEPTSVSNILGDYDAVLISVPLADAGIPIPASSFQGGAELSGSSYSDSPWSIADAPSSAESALVHNTDTFDMIPGVVQSFAGEPDDLCTLVHYDPPLVIRSGIIEYEVHAGYECIPELSTAGLMALTVLGGIFRRKRALFACGRFQV